MPYRPTEKQLLLMCKAYRKIRKRSILPPEPPKTVPEPPQQMPITEIDRSSSQSERETHAMLRQVAEAYTDPTEEEAQADERLLQAVTRVASTEARRYRQRQFFDPSADDDPLPEKPLPKLKSRIEELADYFAQRKEFKSLDMYYLVIYDIQDDRIRTHLFNYLKERGLYHLQKSVFLGRNDRAAYKRICEAVGRIESKLVETDSIVFLPIAENELRKFRIIGRDVEVNAALDEPHTLVF